MRKHSQINSHDEILRYRVRVDLSACGSKTFGFGDGIIHSASGMEIDTLGVEYYGARYGAVKKCPKALLPADPGLSPSIERGGRQRKRKVAHMNLVGCFPAFWCAHNAFRLSPACSGSYHFRS